MKDEALRLALDALENLFGIPDKWTGEGGGDVAVWRLGGSYRAQQAITAIKQARLQSCYCPNCEALSKELAALKAQPASVQDPVAWTDEQMLKMWHEEHDAHKKTSSFAWYKAGIRAANKATPPVAQRQLVGLTDEEIKPLCDENHIIYGAYTVDFIQSIEAKLKEKNHG